jgi:hypothetical protein
MKKLFFVLLVLVLAGTVSAVPAAVTIASPEEGEIFTVGDEVQLQFSTNVKMQAVWVSGSFNGQWVQLFYVSFPDDGENINYSTTIDTTGFPAGPAAIRVFAGYFVDPNDPYSYAHFEKTVNFILTENPEIIEEGPVTVIRSVPDTVYSGGYATVNLIIKPASEFPGIILTENLGTGLQYDYSGGLIPGVQVNVVEQGQTIKFALMNKENISFMSFNYVVYISNELALLPGAEIDLNGTWAIEGTEGTIIGDNLVTLGGFALPDCPFTDQQLLEFIGDWAGNTITNNQMLQAVERWKECQNPV